MCYFSSVGPRGRRFVEPNLLRVAPNTPNTHQYPPIPMRKHDQYPVRHASCVFVLANFPFKASGAPMCLLHVWVWPRALVVALKINKRKNKYKHVYALPAEVSLTSCCILCSLPWLCHRRLFRNEFRYKHVEITSFLFSPAGLLGSRGK